MLVRGPFLDDVVSLSFLSFCHLKATLDVAHAPGCYDHCQFAPAFSCEAWSVHALPVFQWISRDDGETMLEVRHGWAERYVFVAVIWTRLGAWQEFASLSLLDFVSELQG